MYCGNADYSSSGEVASLIGFLSEIGQSDTMQVTGRVLIENDYQTTAINTIITNVQNGRQWDYNLSSVENITVHNNIVYACSTPTLQ